MRWMVFAAIGSLLLVAGLALICLAQTIPVYYAGAGTTFLSNGTIVNGVCPEYSEVLVPTVPNTLHIRATASHPVDVELVHPNGTTLKTWRNQTVDEDYALSECGLWKVSVSSPSCIIFGEVYTTAPLTAHPLWHMLQ